MSGCRFARNDAFFWENDIGKNRCDTCVYVDNSVDLGDFLKK